MIIYKDRNTFLQKLHPLTGVLLILLFIAAILLLNNPVYIIIVFGAVLALAITDGSAWDILKYIKFIIPAAIFIILLNPILNHNGNTILFRTNFKISQFNIIITMEALFFGLIMAIRLIGITAVFALLNLILHPDRTFGFFSKYMGNSAFLMSMTLRLFPSILASCYNIIEAEKLRGSSINDKSLKKRIKYQGNVVNILFITCLEDSADMAESMHSRGYGTGKRSIYFVETYSKNDFILLITAVISLIVFAILQIKGFNDFIFYPQIDNIIKKLSIQGIFAVALLYIPAIVNWGWNLEGSRNKQS